MKADASMAKATGLLISLGIALLFTGCPPPEDDAETKQTAPDSQNTAEEGQSKDGETAGEAPAKSESQPAAPVETTPEPTPLTPTPAAADAAPLDTSQLQVGQKYSFKTPALQKVWKVTAISSSEVSYELTTLAGGTAVGPPSARSFALGKEAVQAQISGLGEKSAEETLQVGARSFKCTVFTKGDRQSWFAQTFPGLLRVEKEGKVILELEKID